MGKFKIITPETITEWIHRQEISMQFLRVANGNEKWPDENPIWLIDDSDPNLPSVKELQAIIKDCRPTRLSNLAYDGTHPQIRLDPNCHPELLKSDPGLNHEDTYVILVEVLQAPKHFIILNQTTGQVLSKMYSGYDFFVQLP